MAAYAAICSLARAIEHLKSNPQISSAHQIDEEIESLCDTTDTLRTFLDERPHEATDGLESQIKEEANRAEDVIERHLASEHLGPSMSPAADDGDRTSSPQGLRRELRRVNEDMSSAVEEIKCVVGETISAAASRERVFGLADEFYELKRLVMGPSRTLKAVSIVGREGMGKTTLALIFYNDAFTSKLFDTRCWVKVSEYYSAEDVLLHLSTAMEAEINEPRKRDDSIEHYVHENLKDKKFLIVLDDVRSTEVFGFLMRVLPENNNGGRILLTTRQEQAAAESVPNESKYLHMNPMSFEESHDLLLHKVFKHKPCPNELKAYVRLIALRCGGWPPAIVLLGEILSKLGKSPYIWQKVFDVVHSFVDEEDDEMFLLLSSTAEKIQKVVGESIAAESLLSIIISDYSSSSSATTTQIEPTSKEKVFGFADEFYKLRRLILGLSYAQYSLKVVPIVGRAGLGKTTLARKFYSDPFTSKRFDISCWVTVSEDYSARDVLLHLAKSMEPFVRGPRKRDESIEQYVHRNLKGKKFLIVLDDVWSMEVLGFLLRILPDNDNGGRILLTTRQEKVAAESVPNQSMYLQMNLMSFEESHDLLLHKVFRHKPCPNELKGYARLIALRSGGWPLVIVLLAGILATLGESQHKWKVILDVLNDFDVDEEEDGYADKMFSSVMSLCYKCLPHLLRSCFLYVGAFPEDYEINISRLAKKWRAHGLLRGPSESDAGKKYLHELVRRNLVSVLKMKSNGEIKSCSLHDEVRGFCIKKAREEGFFHYVMKKHVPEGAKERNGNPGPDETLVGSRMMASSDLDSLVRICSSCPGNTRAIVCFARGRVPLVSMGRFRLLKVLDLTNVEFKSFPIEIFEMFLLSLLALSHVPEVPPSLSNLRYLETLIIHQREESSSSSSSNSVTLPYQTCLPSEIWTMQMLRHLVSFCFSAWPDLEGEESSALTNLETLSAVMNLDCSESMVKMIPRVKKLGLFYFGVERGTHSLKNLEKLNRLEKLKVWALVPFSSPQNLDLGFPATIEKLNLRGINLNPRDLIAIGRLPNLQVLKLKGNAFEDDLWRIDFEGFSKLTYLLLQDLALTHWVIDGDVSILINLETLVIRSCKYLREIPKCVGGISTMKLIEVVGGNKSLAESAKLVVESQRRNGNSRIEDLIMRKN